MTTLSMQAYALVVGTGGSSTLWLFYSAVGNRWPEKYFASDRGVDPIVSRGGPRYVAFRFIPVYITAILCGATAEWWHTNRTFALMWLAVIYIAAGSGRSVVQGLLQKPLAIGIVVFRFASILIILAAVASAALTGGRLDFLLPNADEVLANIWIAVFIIIAAQVAVHLSAQQPATNALSAQSAREVGKTLISKLEQAPDVADTTVLVALALTENLQRPRWIRRLERLKGGPGSYGLMQMHHSAPLTDEQSVDKLLNLLRLGQYPSPNDAGVDWPRDFFLHHNFDLEFASLATSIYFEIGGGYSQPAMAIPADFNLEGGPRKDDVILTSLLEYGEGWRLEGKARSKSAHVRLSWHEASVHTVCIITLPSADRWYEWSVMVPSEWRLVMVSSSRDSGDGEAWTLQRKYDSSGTPAQVAPRSSSS